MQNGVQLEVSATTCMDRSNQRKIPKWLLFEEDHDDKIFEVHISGGYMRTFQI